LVVNPDAVLPGSIVLQLLEVIAGRNPQVPQVGGGIDHLKLSVYDAAQLRRYSSGRIHVWVFPESLEVAVLEFHGTPYFCVTEVYCMGQVVARAAITQVANPQDSAFNSFNVAILILLSRRIIITPLLLESKALYMASSVF
jgi:hypothetical protein